MDQHVVPQPASGGAGEQGAFGCIHVRAVAPCLQPVSAYADNKTVFVSRRSDIKAVKKLVKRYEEVVGAKINFDKSEGPRLGGWRGGVLLPGHFR